MGRPAERAERLPGAGSNRAYYRLWGEDGTTLVGVSGKDVSENAAFVYLSGHLRSKGLPVPRVVAQTADGTRYLQEDLGGTSLFDVLREAREAGGRYSADEEALLEKVVRRLPRFQVLGAQGLDAEKLLPPRRWTARTVGYDLNYFKYCFLRTSDVAFDEDALQDDFEQLAQDLCAPGGEYFLYRDFQARNVMLRGAEPWFIDFQGARLGPLTYDVASFLWQASAKYSPALRERLLGAYLAELSRLVAVDEAAFRAQLRLTVLFRLLQVLGAYGLRGRFERKAHFLRSIPPALASVSELLDAGAAAPYPALEKVLRQLAAKEAERASAAPGAEQGEAEGLTVRVTSFSYKKGLPADPTGNGGGYVFDCRAPHNPGRYARYRHLTGRDEAVIRFLEDDGEIQPFLESVYRLVDFHVKRYLERGFTSLMVSFGCTGGQHRSVYCAEHLAHRLHALFPVRVELWHREQGIREVLERDKK